MSEIAESLAEARARTLGALDQGLNCPCCGQKVMLWPRKLTSSMAYALILIARHYRRSDEWIHCPSFFSTQGLTPQLDGTIRGDYAKLAYWDMIRELPDAENVAGGPRAGYWRTTPKATAFLNGAIVPRYALVYNRVVYGFSDKTTTIRQALGDRFNYGELWTSVVEPQLSMFGDTPE